MTRVLIDLSNICHIVHSVAISTCTKFPGSQFTLLDTFKHHFDGKLRTISNAVLNRGTLEAEFVFVKDEASVRKMLLYPDYKVNRLANDVPIAEAIEHIKSKNYGSVCWSPHNEADDAIATLTQGDGDVIVVSCDKDLWQLLNFENIAVLNPIAQTFGFITRGDIQKFFRVHVPAHIILYKTLWGDVGDGVPNAIPRMQKQLLPIIQQTDGTLVNFKEKLAKEWNKLTPRCRKVYSEGEGQLDTNYELVKLDRNCEIVWDNEATLQ